MGVKIIKEINLCHSIYCFNYNYEKNSEVANDKISNINFKENGISSTFSSNKLIQLNSRKKIKPKKLRKFSHKNNFSLLNSFINDCLPQEYEINIYKIIKLQSYIRKFLVRKKYNLDIINYGQEKKDNGDEDFLAISFSIEDNLFSPNSDSNNYKNKKLKNVVNRKYFPFILKSKKNVEYKYFGYMKNLKNKNKVDNNKNGSNKEINNIKNGFGKIIFDDKAIFKSNFIENKASGISQYIDSNKKEVFVVEYKNNIINGFGIYTYNSDNYRITGYFENDGLYGIGIEESNYNKYTYFGQFYQNKKHGIGTIQWNGQTKYSGEFFKNELHGKALIEYPGNKIYKGYVHKGRLDGFGEFIWPQGKKYTGFYKNNKKEGFGVFLWEYNNKNIKFEKIKAFIGFWSKGNMNGIGIRINCGKLKYGIWKNGKIIRWFEKKEMTKKFIDISQKKYLKIFLGNENEIFHLLQKYYYDEQIDDEIQIL